MRLYLGSRRLVATESFFRFQHQHRVLPGSYHVASQRNLTRTCPTASSSEWKLNTLPDYREMYRQSIEDPGAFFGTVRMDKLRIF
jgi:hypothetical protein